LAAHPTGVVAGDWQVDLSPTGPIGLPWTLVLASIGIPVILCSIAFLVLAPRLPKREQRYRATLVGSSILVWVGSGLFAQVAGGAVAKFVTLVLFGLAAAVLVL